MRLPRLHLSLGTLLFAVAVVAANCWSFRRFYERMEYSTGQPNVFMPTEVGVLPLVNIALIGTLLCATRRLRSLFRGGVANPCPSRSAVAFFSLHFLMLGGLACMFEPDAMSRYMQAFDPLVSLAMRGWAAVIGQTKSQVPWIVFECSIYGLVISGPPLFLSWVGHVLARRCARALPRRRFQAMTCLVSLGFTSAALALCLTPQPFEDEQEVTLDFQVVDETSRRPITAAFVCLTHPFSFDSDPPPSRALTDRGGHARLRGRFVASGQRNAFQTMGIFSPWGRWLEVSAANHRTRRIPLTEILGSFADPVRPSVGTVNLVRGETPENPFRGVADSYSVGSGFGGCWIEIEPDGRFAWCEWGCTYRYEEYGHVKLDGGDIELVSVAHPGREIHPSMNVKYRVVEWGKCRYFCEADEPVLRDFCRQALTPNRPPSSDTAYRILSRVSDRAKPQAGLPRLPLKVWARFLIDEMSLNNEKGNLRLSLDSLIPQNPREERSPRTQRTAAALP
jgi:hypothetical protein